MNGNPDLSPQHSTVEPTDPELAVRLATEAGTLLLALRAELAGNDADEKTIKDEGDRRSHVWLMGELATARPDDAVLSEEGKDDKARLAASRVWIIDPLDGTREFGEGRDDRAVHVALALDGVPTAGAVALPGLGVTLGSVPAARVPDRPADSAVRLVVSRSRPPALATAVAESLDGVLLPMGSAGAKAMAVVRGEADVYVHGGGQYEWDNCAPAAVALAAGLHVSRLDGTPLRYNNADPYLPDLIVCRAELAEAVLAAVAASGEI